MPAKDFNDCVWMRGNPMMHPWPPNDCTWVRGNQVTIARGCAAICIDASMECHWLHANARQSSKALIYLWLYRYCFYACGCAAWTCSRLIMTKKHTVVALLLLVVCLKITVWGLLPGHFFYGSRIITGLALRSWETGLPKMHNCHLVFGNHFTCQLNIQIYLLSFT